MLQSFWGSLLIAFSGTLNLFIYSSYLLFDRVCSARMLFRQGVARLRDGCHRTLAIFLSYHLYKGNEILIFKDFANFRPLRLSNFSPVEKIYIIVLIFIFIISLAESIQTYCKTPANTQKNQLFCIEFCLLLLLNLCSSRDAWLSASYGLLYCHVDGTPVLIE